MAKVQLEAFQGKLRSDYIDWPDGKIGEDIHLLLDISNRGMLKSMNYGEATYEYTSRVVRGIFEYSRTAGVYLHPDNETTEVIHLYKLVSVG